MNTPVFSAQSEWLARVEIVAAPRAAFAMRDAGVVHHLGFAESPAYTLLEAPSTDDAWKLGVRDTARWIEIADAADDGPLSHWLPDEHRAAGLGLAAHLPEGSYWWVRSRIEPSERVISRVLTSAIRARPSAKVTSITAPVRDNRIAVRARS